MQIMCPCALCFGCCCGRSPEDCINAEDDARCACGRCIVCSKLIPQDRLDYGFKTCVKHSDEKKKDHQPGVVNSLGLHEKYFPEGR